MWHQPSTSHRVLVVVVVVLWLMVDVVVNKEIGKDFSKATLDMPLSQSNGENETVYDDIVRLNNISLQAFYNDRMKKYRPDLVHYERNGEMIKKDNIEEEEGQKKDNDQVERIIRSIHRKLTSHISRRKLSKNTTTTTTTTNEDGEAAKRNLNMQGRAVVVETYPNTHASEKLARDPSPPDMTVGGKPLAELLGNELTTTEKIVGKVRSTDQILESYGTNNNDVDESILQFHKKQQSPKQGLSARINKEYKGSNNKVNFKGLSDANADKPLPPGAHVENHRSGLNPDVLLTDAQHIDEQSQQLKSIAKELDAKAELLRTQALTSSGISEAKKPSAEHTDSMETSKTEVYQGSKLLSSTEDESAGKYIPAPDTEVSAKLHANENKDTEINSNKIAYHNPTESQESRTQGKTSTEEYFSPHKTSSSSPVEDEGASNEKTTSTIDSNGNTHTTPEQRGLPCPNPCPVNSAEQPMNCQCVSFAKETYKLDDGANGLQKDPGSSITTGEERNLCTPMTSSMSPPKWSGPNVRLENYRPPTIGNVQSVQSVGAPILGLAPMPVNIPCQRPVVITKEETHSAPVVVSLKLPPGGPKKYELTLKEIVNKTIYPSQLMAPNNSPSSRHSLTSFPISLPQSSPSSSSQAAITSSTEETTTTRVIDDTKHMPVTEEGFRGGEQVKNTPSQSSQKFEARKTTADATDVESVKSPDTADVRPVKTSDTLDFKSGKTSDTPDFKGNKESEASDLKSSKNLDASNFKSNKESDSSDFKSTKESDASNYKSTKESDASNFKSTKESDASDVKPTKESDASNFKSNKESDASNLKSTKESDASNFKSTKESDASNFKSNKESDASNLKSTKESDASNIKSTKESDASGFKSTKESDASNFKSAKEPDASDYKSTKESDASNFKSAKESDASNFKSSKESDASNLKSTKESDASDFKSTKESDASNFKSSKESDASNFKSTKEADTSNLKSTKESDASDFKSTKESDASNFKSTKESDTSNLKSTKESDASDFKSTKLTDASNIKSPKIPDTSDFQQTKVSDASDLKPGKTSDPSETVNSKEDSNPQPASRSEADTHAASQAAEPATEGNHDNSGSSSASHANNDQASEGSENKKFQKQTSTGDKEVAESTDDNNKHGDIGDSSEVKVVPKENPLKNNNSKSDKSSAEVTTSAEGGNGGENDRKSQAKEENKKDDAGPGSETINQGKEVTSAGNNSQTEKNNAQ